MRLRRVLILTGVTALLTGLLVYWLLMTMVAPGQVVITTVAVAERTALTSDMLMAVRMPRAGIHSEAIRSVDDAVGRAVVYPLAPGEQILESKLADSVNSGRISGQLAAGERAMLIPVAADRAVGGAIVRHDRVDVLFVANSSRVGYQGTTTILSGVEVLDVIAANGGIAAEGGEGIIVRVSPEAAEALSFAICNGDVFVTLSGYPGAGTASPVAPE